MQLRNSLKAGWYTASKFGENSEDWLADLGPCISALLKSASRRRRKIACLEFNDSEMRRSWKDCAVLLPRFRSMNLDLKRTAQSRCCRTAALWRVWRQDAGSTQHSCSWRAPAPILP